MQSCVTMHMKNYNAAEGDVVIRNESGRELTYGDCYEIQVYQDGNWYSILLIMIMQDIMILHIWYRIRVYPYGRLSGVIFTESFQKEKSKTFLICVNWVILQNIILSRV